MKEGEEREKEERREGEKGVKGKREESLDLATVNLGSKTDSHP